MRPETERVCFCLVSKIFAGLSISDYGGRSQQKKKAFETFAVFATAAMLDLITLVSAVGLQQELKKAEQSEVIREDHQDMDFLGSAAEQISVAIDSFESFLSQGLDMLKEEEKAPVKKA